jgi:hypothetical protein
MRERSHLVAFSDCQLADAVGRCARGITISSRKVYCAYTDEGYKARRHCPLRFIKTYLIRRMRALIALTRMNDDFSRSPVNNFLRLLKKYLNKKIKHFFIFKKLTSISPFKV